MRPIADVIILILSVPVLLIAIISIAVYYVVYSLLTFFNSETAKEEVKGFREEISLVDKPAIQITLIEDIDDEQLTMANENWATSVYGGDTNLYRVKTEPVISELHNSICCFFFLELDEWCILQQVKDHSGTRLLAVNSLDRQLIDLGSVGNYYLYRDEKLPTRIRGLNHSDEITIDLVETNLQK